MIINTCIDIIQEQYWCSATMVFILFNKRIDIIPQRYSYYNSIDVIPQWHWHYSTTVLMSFNNGIDLAFSTIALMLFNNGIDIIQWQYWCI